jgi:hypothetical protein
MGNVFQLIGELDDKTSAHGRFSLKVTLSEPNLPTFYFDWFDPIRQPVRSIVVAHHGWVTVNRGQPYTLSAFMKANRPNVVGVLFVRQSDGRNLSRNFTLTTDWQRYSFTFAPQAEFIWVGSVKASYAPLDRKLHASDENEKGRGVNLAPIISQHSFCPTDIASATCRAQCGYKFVSPDTT